MELWDVYDSDRNPLGRTHPRGPMRPEEYHICISVWTVNSQNEILVTLRDPEKEPYPGTWECTGGSALAGETSREGAVRELLEETGISASGDELILLGTVFEPNSAFHDLYLLHRDTDISELTMQPGETVDAKWITVMELDVMISDGSLAEPCGKRLNMLRNAFDKQLDMAGV